jgi:inner membrane protein
MDPFTQGIVATAATQTYTKKNNILIASIIGFLAGLAPDIDIFIRSSTDPLLFLEYHRQFTHSLFFIPIGSFICAIVFYFLFTKRFNLSFKFTYIFSIIGYSTHGIIDTFTTYGTQLLWPFTDERLAWNTISVIDPLFTLPVAFLCTISFTKKNKIFSFYAIAWMVIYQTTALLQQHRAEEIISNYALEQGHIINKIEAKPSFANIIVWKVIYSDDQYFYVNAVRLGWAHRIIKGDKILKLNAKRDFTWLDINSQQAKDLERFRWFSNDYLGTDKNNNNIVYDIRFSAMPNEVEGLWGIRLDKNKSKSDHIEYVTNRKKNVGRYPELIRMIVNDDN